MRGHSKLVFMVAGLSIAISQAASGAVPNPTLWNGTWHLNAAKSKFASPSREESGTRSYDMAGNKVKVKSSSRDAAGKELNFSYSAAFDGKWYPMVGNLNSDRISLTAVSDRELKSSSQFHGKPTVEATATVSADGKHLTITRKMVGMKGTPTDVLEYDR